MSTDKSAAPVPQSAASTVEPDPVTGWVGDRLRNAAEKALAAPTTSPEPDWKQDQAETSRLPRDGAYHLIRDAALAVADNCAPPEPDAVREANNDRHYLTMIRQRLEQLYEEHPDDARLREQVSDECDWINAALARKDGQSGGTR